MSENLAEFLDRIDDQLIGINDQLSTLNELVSNIDIGLVRIAEALEAR